MRFPSRLSILLAAAAVSAPAPAAAQRPESALVVVNSRSAESRAVGEYYVRVRGIPPGNVCTISTADQEEIDRAVYDRDLAGRISACLKEKGLVERIDFIVLTLGVPLKIRGSAGLEGEQAAVDSELTLLYAQLQGKKFPVAGSVANPLFGKVRLPFHKRAFPVYLVARLGAYDTGTVKAMIQRSAAAKNRGRFVVDARSEADEPGDDWLRDAAIRLPKERVIYDQSREVLSGKADVIGYASWGSNDPARRTRLPGFRWLPGAVATQFVSTDARTLKKPPKEWTIGPWSKREALFAGSPQSMAADLLEEGATAATGHVYEPYLKYTPRPDILLPAYAAGRSLGEAFYLSIPALSWQNVLLGDPLCVLR